MRAETCCHVPGVAAVSRACCGVNTTATWVWLQAQHASAAHAQAFACKHGGMSNQNDIQSGAATGS